MDIMSLKNYEGCTRVSSIKYEGNSICLKPKIELYIQILNINAWHIYVCMCVLAEFKRPGLIQICQGVTWGILHNKYVIMYSSYICINS